MKMTVAPVGLRHSKNGLDITLRIHINIIHRLYHQFASNIEFSCNLLPHVTCKLENLITWKTD
jgi:hypothetical protein